MDGTVTFGQWVRRRRTALGLTQAQLGGTAACAPITVRKIEADERRPSDAMARALADALRIPDHERERFLSAAHGHVSAVRLAPALASVTSVAPGAIPLPMHRLVGRDAEVSELVGLLGIHGGPARLVTLIGPPGVGKTRLAVDVALDAATRGRCAVYVVDLGAVTDPDLVGERISTSLGLPGGSDEALATFLDREPTLLVLDNVEQVLAAGPSIAALVARVAGLCCLVTSRVPLGVYGEYAFQVEPLGLGEGASAAELFVQRVIGARRGVDTPAPLVARICARLDGIPLALEMAAARVRHLDLPELDAELASGLGSLASTAAGADPRHRTMTDAVEWGYTVVSPEEQRSLRAASWVAGPIDATLLSALTGSTAGEAADALRTLADHQLLRPADGDYEMYEVVRAVARERADDHGETRDVRDRLSRALLATLVDTEPAVPGMDLPDRLDAIARQYDDLLASMEWCLADGGDPAVARGLAWQLTGYWVVRTVGSGVAVQFAERAVASADDPEERARPCAVLAMVLLLVDAARAEHLASEVAGSTQDLAARAAAHHVLALLGMMGGDTATATGHLTAGRALYAAQGNDCGVGLAEMALGRVAAMGGDLDAFAAHLDVALDAFTRAGQPFGRANVLADIAEVAVLQGRPTDALGPLRTALGLLIGAHAEWHAASYLAVLAAAHAGDDPWRGGLSLGMSRAWLEDLGMSTHPFAAAMAELASASLHAALGGRLAEALDEGGALPRTSDTVESLTAAAG